VRVIGLLGELKEMVAGNTAGRSQVVHAPVFVGGSALMEINAVSVGPVPTGENRLERVAVIPGRLRSRSLDMMTLLLLRMLRRRS
jgi:hypothetical protein